MSLKFGTDGVRGVANEDLTPEFAFHLGQAAGHYVNRNKLTPRAVLGRDTRRSGPMLGAALASGLCSVGIDVCTLGVVPTGCVSYVARTEEFGLAAVISASHNPARDNGIKLLAHDGTKVSEEAEVWIEAHLGHFLVERPQGGEVGSLCSDRDPVDAYMDFLEGLVPERLDGMKVAVDCADGAAFELGPEIFRRVGATVVTTAAEPDGMNINERGGATKPSVIQELAAREGVNLGVAFDGDADRAVFSDSAGHLINGDRTMAVWCAHWRQEGKLDPPVVVGTVMSNGGFEAYMASTGVELQRVDVGDKHVSARLRAIGGKIGGEQSGHIVFTERGPTGDGLVTALEFARVLKREGKTARDLYGAFANWPQLLVNVSVVRKDGWQAHVGLQEAIRAAEAALAGHGRVNVRASGTQPMLRVMVEADEEGLRNHESDRVVQAMLSALGGEVYSRVDLTHSLGE